MALPALPVLGNLLWGTTLRKLLTTALLGSGAYSLLSKKEKPQEALPTMPIAPTMPETPKQPEYPLLSYQQAIEGIQPAGISGYSPMNWDLFNKWIKKYNPSTKTIMNILNIESSLQKLASPDLDNLMRAKQLYQTGAIANLGVPSKEDTAMANKLRALSAIPQMALTPEMQKYIQPLMNKMVMDIIGINPEDINEALKSAQGG